jgi:hypothetical protein
MPFLGAAQKKEGKRRKQGGTEARLNSQFPRRLAEDCGKKRNAEQQRVVIKLEEQARTNGGDNAPTWRDRPDLVFILNRACHVHVCNDNTRSSKRPKPNFVALASLVVVALCWLTRSSQENFRQAAEQAVKPNCVLWLYEDRSPREYMKLFKEFTADASMCLNGVKQHM